MGNKSQTCRGRATGAPLNEYSSEASALEGAAFVLRKYGHEMSPYRCPRCRKWHLAPADRQTPSRPSICTGRDGTSKAAYESQDAAERRAELIWLERTVRVRAYSCSCGEWHLTSR